MKAYDGKVIQDRIARSNGVRVIVEYLPSADEENPWQTTCSEHGGVCSHTTRALALSHAALPEGWCEDCQYGPGTLAGTNVPEGFAH